MNAGNSISGSTSGPKLALWIGGGVGLVALGAMATALVLRPSAPAAEPAEAAAVVATPHSNKAKAAHSSSTATARAGEPRPVDTQPAVAATPVCGNCGVVETVTAVEQRGEGSGLGAVAGGVIGGVLGNQMGAGSGKQAMTVIGAVGGGLAGNEIEKRQRATTVYQVKVRMADGTTRTITQAAKVAEGQAVEVDGNQLKLVTAPVGAGKATAAPRMQEASAKS